MRQQRRMVVRLLAGACLALLILLFEPPDTQAAGPTPFATVYGGSGDEVAQDVLQTADGGTILVGYTESYGLGDRDVWVLKLAANGEVTWQKTVGGAGADVAAAVQQTGDGSYLVAGHTESYGAGSADGWLLKLNANGGLVWQQTYGGAQRDEFYALKPVGADSFVVGGYTESSGQGEGDAWVLKLDGGGAIAWQKTFGGPKPERAYDLQPVSDGGYLVSGYTESYGQGATDAWAIKLTGSGAVTWQKTYGGSVWDVLLAAEEAADGGYLVAGYTYSYDVGGGDGWVLKLNVNGTVAWQKTYGGTDVDSVQAIRQTADGGYVLAGFTASYGVAGRDAWLLKLYGTGDVAWQMTYGGLGEDNAVAVQQTAEGGYAAAGQTAAFSAGGADAWLLKTGGDGIIHGVCDLPQASSTSAVDSASAATASSATAGNSSVTPGESDAPAANTNVSAAYVCITEPALPFAAAYGGGDWDEALDIRQTRDGGYVVAGRTQSYGDNHYDAWVLKLEASGKVDWQTAVGWDKWDEVRGIQELAGGYLVAGTTHSVGVDRSDLWLIKLNANGGLAWQKTYGGVWYDDASAIQPTTDGGFVLAGTIDHHGADQSDAWVLKLDSAGNQAWSKAFGGPVRAGAYKVQQTGDGGYIVAGWVRPYTADAKGDALVLKLNANGTLAWQKSYGGSDNEYARAIQQTGDGGYIVAGTSYSYGAGERDVWVLKLKADGTVTWQKTYGGAGVDRANAIQQTGDGGYLVAGLTYSHGTGNADLWLIKLNADGSVQWTKTYGGTLWDAASSVRQTGDGGYVVSGETVSFGAGSHDFWVLKLESDGMVCEGCGLGQAAIPTVADSNATAATAGSAEDNDPVTTQSQTSSVESSDAVADPTCACGLCLSKEVSPPGEVAKNSTLLYTVVLENSGELATAGVAVTDTLPPQVDFESWYEKPVGAQVVGDELTWSGTLDAGQVVTFALRADHIGDYHDVVVNTARFAHNERSGSDAVTSDILGPGSLWIEKYVTPTESVAHNGTVTYTIHLANNGPTDVTGVTLVDRLPLQVVYGHWLSGPTAQLEDGVLTWQGTVAQGQTLTFRFTAIHTGARGDVVKNVADYADATGGDSAQATFYVEGFGHAVYLPTILRDH